LVTPQPHKRPKASFVRFEAQLPNELWQTALPSGCLPTRPGSRSSTSSTLSTPRPTLDEATNLRSV
jgi:hypothetical protein